MAAQADAGIIHSMNDARDLSDLIQRLHDLLDRIEPLLPVPGGLTADTLAYRWGPARGLQPIARPQQVAADDLLGIDVQKAALLTNTAQFVHGLPANHALLWGARGTGKSSLIKATLHSFAARGLRLIEVDKADLAGLPALASELDGREERFLIYCDDLSFEADDASYKTLKAALDGSLAAAPENLLIYASSNRRHLLPETMAENHQARVVDGELHHADAVEEKISLSERFGLWLAFHPFTQEQYLAIVRHWLARLGADIDDPASLEVEAARYARARGSRSGRVAWQFARDLAGRQALARG